MDLPAIFISSLERAPWGWTLLIVTILALIKIWPLIQLQTIKAREALRSEKRDDLHTCQARLDKLETELGGAVQRIHALELKLLGTVSAYRILETEIEQGEPASVALLHARVIFREVWDAMPVPAEMAEVIAKMA